MVWVLLAFLILYAEALINGELAGGEDGIESVEVAEETSVAGPGGLGIPASLEGSYALGEDIVGEIIETAVVLTP